MVVVAERWGAGGRKLAVCQRIYTSNYKMNSSQGANVQHDDYCWWNYILYLNLLRVDIRYSTTHTWKMRVIIWCDECVN